MVDNSSDKIVSTSASSSHELLSLNINFSGNSKFGQDLIHLLERHQTGLSSRLSALQRQQDVIIELLSRSTATIGSTLRHDLESGLSSVLLELKLDALQGFNIPSTIINVSSSTQFTTLHQLQQIVEVSPTAPDSQNIVQTTKNVPTSSPANSSQVRQIRERRTRRPIDAPPTVSVVASSTVATSAVDTLSVSTPAAPAPLVSNYVVDNVKKHTKHVTMASYNTLPSNHQPSRISGVSEKKSPNIRSSSRSPVPDISVSSDGSPSHHSKSHNFFPISLFEAVSTQDNSMVKKLTENGTNVNIVTSRGDTPLHLASASGDTDIIKTLVKHGASLSQLNDLGETPLVKAAATLNQFISQQNIPASNSKNLSTSLCDGILALISFGSPLNHADTAGMTALHYACGSGPLSLVRSLTSAGASVNVTDNGGATPLHCAVQSQDADIVSHLVNVGADVNVADSDGATPLRWAAGVGNAEVVAALLYSNALLELTGSDGETALHRAAVGGHYTVTELLLDAGARCDAVSTHGLTPLHKAFESDDITSSLDTALTLLDAGANADQQDNDGNTPLHWASLNGHVGGVELLLGCCCNLTLRNVEGETALGLAILADNKDIVEMLQEAEADVV